MSDTDKVFRDRTHPPTHSTMALELERFVTRGIIFWDTRVGATLREFHRLSHLPNFPDDHPSYRTECLCCTPVVPRVLTTQGYLMRFYKETGDYPQKDSNHFTRFFDVVVRRHDVGERMSFGYNSKTWGWEWIGPEIDFLIRHLPIARGKTRVFDEAFQLCEARMTRGDEQAEAWCLLFEAERRRRDGR